MFNYFYRLLIDGKLSGNNLFDYLEVAKKYDKVMTKERLQEARVLRGNDETGWKLIPYIEVNAEEAEPLFIKIDDKVDDGSYEEYCVFYWNLFLTFSIDAENGNRIVRAYVKKPDDGWTFDKVYGNGLMHPTNVHAEVYTDYDINVLKLSRCYGQDYKSGSWNKMFYRTICSFMETVQGYTEISRIKNAYKNERRNTKQD